VTYHRQPSRQGGSARRIGRQRAARQIGGRRWLWALALVAAGCVVTVIGVQVDLV